MYAGTVYLHALYIDRACAVEGAVVDIVDILKRRIERYKLEYGAGGE